MAYAFAAAKCYSCGRAFTFNPLLVPVYLHDGK